MAHDDVFGDLPTLDKNIDNKNVDYNPSLNRVCLVGNLVDNPRKAYTKSGKPVTSFRIYVKRPFIDENTGKKESDFIDIEVWDNLAENCDKYLEKGKKVAVVGELRIANYIDKNNNERDDIKVVASRVDFM